MAELTNSCISCGVDELYELDSDPRITIRDLVSKLVSEVRDFSFSMLIFSDNVEHGNGARLAKYIKDHKAGSVIASRKMKNRNHPDNTIQTWIWHVPALRTLKKAVGWTAQDTKEVRIQFSRFGDSWS